MRLLRWLVRPRFPPGSEDAYWLRVAASVAGALAIPISMAVWLVIADWYGLNRREPYQLPVPEAPAGAWLLAVNVGIGTGLSIFAVRFGGIVGKCCGGLALVGFGLVLVMYYGLGLTRWEWIVEYWREVL